MSALGGSLGEACLQGVEHAGDVRGPPVDLIAVGASGEMGLRPVHIYRHSIAYRARWNDLRRLIALQAAPE